MNLEELARLADAAQDVQSRSLLGYACTPERIAALVRVAQAAQKWLYAGPNDFQDQSSLLRILGRTLRDLEATP